MTRLCRRIFVLGGLATAGATIVPLSSAHAAPPYPFKLGVGSGEPAADSVVLWTRRGQHGRLGRLPGLAGADPDRLAAATVTRAQIQADFRAVATVSEHGAPVTTARSFAILDGRPGLQVL